MRKILESKFKEEDQETIMCDPSCSINLSVDVLPSAPGGVCFNRYRTGLRLVVSNVAFVDQRLADGASGGEMLNSCQQKLKEELAEYMFGHLRPLLNQLRKLSWRYEECKEFSIVLDALEREIFM